MGNGHGVLDVSCGVGFFFGGGGGKGLGGLRVGGWGSRCAGKWGGTWWWGVKGMERSELTHPPPMTSFMQSCMFSTF